MKVIAGLLILIALQVAFWSGMIWLAATIVKGVFGS
jgi:hypothetical protein